MLIKKNPVLTGFHPDPICLLCAKGGVTEGDGGIGKNDGGYYAN